jgi:hypothetical protein
MDLHQTLADKLSARITTSELWLGRCVKVVDGTGVSMPDTAANQQAWPQPAGQKSGCGFPVVKLVACFCLASGALLHWVEGTLKEHDCRLLQKLLSVFKKGETVLADRGFGSYASLATLWARCGLGDAGASFSQARLAHRPAPGATRPAGDLAERSVAKQAQLPGIMHLREKPGL